MLKQLLLKLVLPLTIISFGIFTKWWYVLPVDGPDTMMSGFPMPFISDGWASSMSIQFFVLEFLLDLLTYFLFWLIIVLIFHHFAKRFSPGKVLTTILYSLSALFIVFYTWLISIDSANSFHLHRWFELSETMDTGYSFDGWPHNERPDFYKYHPESNKKVNKEIDK